MDSDQLLYGEEIDNGDSERRAIRELWEMIESLRDAFNERRRSNGQKAISKKEIAESIGVHKNTLGDWFRHKRTVPEWYAVTKMVEFLEGTPKDFKVAWNRADEARLRLSQLSYRSSQRPNTLNLVRRRWEELPQIWRSTVTWTAGTVTVAIVATVPSSTNGSNPSSDDSRTQWARIVNTYSAAQGKNIGVIPRTDPFSNRPAGSGYDEGVPVEIVCQERHGSMIKDPTFGDRSRVWDKLKDGTWVPDFYTDLPKVKVDTPPLGLPVCPR